jgi:nitrogenase subunit NifH
MRTKLDEEEEIVESFPADLLTSGTPSAGTGCSGAIFLTNLRFIYEKD